jgi:hypothetical protein
VCDTRGERVKIRILKIAVSAVSVLACVLLIALWVRSQRVADVVHWAPSSRFTMYLSSGSGVIVVSVTPKGVTPKLAWTKVEIMPGPVQRWQIHSGRDGTSLRFPHRLPIAVLALLAVAPWIRWRFSLRAVMIAVAVVSLLLGSCLYFGR